MLTPEQKIAEYPLLVQRIAAPEALALLVGGIELKHGSLKPWYER